MSDIKIYHNPRCSKSRQTKSILDERNLEYQIIEYLDQPPSQQELAEKVSVSRQTIIAIEKGKFNPSMKLALSIARVFNVNVEEIFYLEEK